MTAGERLWLLLAVAATLAAGILLFLYRRQKRKIDRLAAAAEDFAAHGTLPAYSLEDDRFSRLANSFAQLEEQLLQEKSNTQRALQENTAFIADVSHQLKTPLAGIRLYCELEQTSHDPAHTEKQLRLVEKMEKLVFDLLRLEKLRADSYTLEPQATELDALLRQSIGELRPLFPAKHITLAGTATLRCDRSWMAEALGNVLKNACEHTAPDGSIAVAVTQSDTAVTILIEDDGGGIPEQELPLLFRRFGQTAGKTPGSTGLGLAITRTVVEKHHGTVSAENAAKGLRLALCFPHMDGSLPI